MIATDEPIDFLLKSLSDRGQVLFIKLITILREEKKVPEAVMSNVQAFRFFIGNGKDVNLALEAIEQNIKWRSTFQFDWPGLVDEAYEKKLQDYVQVNYYGTDFKGRPIRIIQVKHFDPDEFVNAFEEKEFIANEARRLERFVNIILPICSRDAKRHIEGALVIVYIKDMNIKGLLLKPKTIDTLKNVSKVFQPNYPELTYKCIVINSGLLFSGLWKLISVFLKKQTVDKFTILNDDYMPELLKYTTIDKIPKKFGGTCPYDIDSYPNIFGKEMQDSIDQKRLGFSQQ